MELFGERIRNLREKEDLPLRKVAAYLDIDASILSKIERGERNPNKQLVIRIAEYFSIDKNQLLKDYFAESVANLIYKEDDYLKILDEAKTKAEYLNIIKHNQASISFNE